MKTKNYMLGFVTLMILVAPLCVYGVEPVENDASNSKHKMEKKSINKEPNKHKEDTGDISKNGTEDTPMIKTQRLQYTQLLEVHRSYFMAFLQVLAIYLAVMGACLKFICDSIEKMKNGDKKEVKNGDKKGSRTVLFALITFAVLTSSLFLLGLRFGERDAKERNGQIADVAELLCISEPVKTELITRLFIVMAIGTALIVVGWYVMFIRGLMAAGKKKKPILTVATLALLIYWLVVSLGHWQNLYCMTLIGIVTLPIIIYWVVTLLLDRQKPLGTSYIVRLDKSEVKDLRPCNKEDLLEFVPKEFDPGIIARHHREMFRLHDLRDWDNLKKNAREMIVALGYNPEAAQKASEFVLEAYRNADLAAKAQKSGNTDKERISYNNTLNSFVLASESLGSDTAGIKYKIGWYKFERHNKPFLVAYYLFREHLKRFGILHLGIVICTIWIAFWGGYFAHKKHDWKKLESVMIKYWKYIHKVCPIRPPLQI